MGVMSLNPLNELKRRLEDDSIPLPKRLCLAKNIVHSFHFPTVPKERIIAAWLDDLAKDNQLSSEDLQKVLDWLSVDDLTGELKSKLIQVVSQFVQRNTLQHSEIHYIIAFLENNKVTAQLCLQIDDFLTISTTLLNSLISSENASPVHRQKLLRNYIRYYKESKKKLEFIIKFLELEHLETIFSYLETDCRSIVIEVCKTVFFPINKKTFFISYLQTLIRKDNIDELIAEKGDNIQSVLKIMGTFFNFPKHRTVTEPKFIKNFIDVFVSCFSKENQIVFAFYIMVGNVLKMEQNYIIPSMNMKPIIFDENDHKIKRNLFLNMLEIVLENEIDINVRLTDTFGEKISKVEIKKNFLLFLEEVMMGQLKLDGKIDKVTVEIVKAALKLDPSLIEQKMAEILPPLMASKKSSSTSESYKTMLNCLLETLFKLSRGTTFLSQILPSINLILEAGDIEQIELKKKLTKATDNNCEKIETKQITGNDIFPQECVDLFGKLTTDLMFRQNNALFEDLLKDFEEHCLSKLEEELVTPSVITIAEVISAILSCFLRHNKMADHTVPHNIGEDFWNTFTKLGEDFLRKFGQCLLKSDYDQSLIKSYLNICVSYSEVRLLNIKYSNFKVPSSTDNIGVLLPCLSEKEWGKLAEKATSDEAVLLLDNLFLLRTMEMAILMDNLEESQPKVTDTKSYLIKQLNLYPHILEMDKCFARALLKNLDQNQNKQVAKALVKLHLNGKISEIFNDVAITNNRFLLNALVLEVVKNITKCLNNCETMTKALKKDLNIANLAKEVDIIIFFNNLTVIEDSEDKIRTCIELLKLLKLPYLEENFQLTAIFVLLALKRCCQSKKIRKTLDYILLNIFELSYNAPDLYKVFSIRYIFSFTDNTLMDLLILKIKTLNPLLVVKILIESAVKRVKSESHLVKDIVELLLSKNIENANTIDAFGDRAFQICCIILPLIVKQKKTITASAFRSILADLQEKLHKKLLDTFNEIDFKESSKLGNNTGNVDDSMVESEGNMAALNAISAYTLTLSKYCETTDAEEIKKLDCLWSGLEFFIQNALQSIVCADSKTQHVESSIQLLNVTLRYIKKLDSHPIFDEKDKLFVQIWQKIILRLKIMYQNGGRLKNCGYLEELGVTLRFICELVSVDAFHSKFVNELASLVIMKKPTQMVKESTKSDLTNHLVAKYLWTQCLKANTTGPKCNAMAKVFYQNSRNLVTWIRQHYDSTPIGHNQNANKRKRKLDVYSEDNIIKTVKVDDTICNILRVDLDLLTEVIFAGKKIIIDYKFLDSIFELQQMVQYILGVTASQLRCEIAWTSFFVLYEVSVAILNSLLISREEILEDRWPCYMQCYRALTSILCEKSSSNVQLDKNIEEKLAEMAYSIEKLTQLITKRKKQLSRIVAYTVADICFSLEKNAPSRMVRQHLENSTAMLIQASDYSYAMAFLKRALAGSVGQMTMTNLYAMYKRYHKYTGNA